MTDVYLGGITLPVVSEELIAALDSAFQRPEVSPGVDRDNLMYQAGQRSVVEWIREKASVNRSSGDPVKTQRATVRMGS